MRNIVISCLVCLLGACGSTQEEKPPVVDCQAAQPIPAFSHVEALQTVCTNCHSTTLSGDARNGAPSSINFDDYASAEAHANQAAIEVNVGAMPPSDSDMTLTDAQKTELFSWALCGAPE